MVYKRTIADGSPNQSYDAGSAISLPLLVQDGACYITPDNSTVYSVNASNLTSENWTCNVTDNNTGPAFIEESGSNLYVAVSDSVKKISISAGTQTMAFDAGATVSSGPIVYGNYVYFGVSNGNYYAITTDGAGVAKWPFSNTSGNANTGPWIDIGNAQVIFATTGGNIDAFDLESP
jgi:hypothetical protein